MLRRSSSLVTISLDDEATDEEIESSRNPAAVIEIWQNDDFNVEIDGFRSAEKIFTFVVDIDQHESRVEQDHPTGIRSKIVYCFQNCKSGNLCSRVYKNLSEVIGKIWENVQDKVTEKCGKSYLETYFMYANVCGVSPFRIGHDSQRVVWLRKVPYFIVNTLATVDTALMSKTLMLNLIGAHEERSTDIGLYLFNSSVGANILIRTGFLVSLKFHPEKYIKAVRTIATSTYAKHLYTVKKFMESLLICGSSLSMVVIKTNLGLFDGLEKFIIGNAKLVLSQFCFTKPCPLDDWSQISYETILLGLLGWSIVFAGNLVEQIARDGIFLSALALGKSANEFRFKRLTKSCTPMDSIVIGAEIETDYKWIKKISKHINSAFNIVFRFFLLANIFMFAVFVDEWFNPNVGKLIKGMNLANVMFVCITFYYANQTAKTGDRFREWMKKEKNRSVLKMSQMDVMMENSSSTSIGFGRGALFIYDATLIGFASVVAAYYFGIVETRPQYMEYGTENNCACTNSTGVR